MTARVDWQEDAIEKYYHRKRSYCGSAELNEYLDRYERFGAMLLLDDSLKLKLPLDVVAKAIRMAATQRG